MSKTSILCRHDIRLVPQSARVIIRPFIPSDGIHISTIIGRALALSEAEVAEELELILAGFNERHLAINDALLRHYLMVSHHIESEPLLSDARKLLIGALFSGEYSLESAALFNPSIVPHPDQTGLIDSSLRFVMSLRATGEGHISSIEFRSGVITKDGCITLDPVSRFVSTPEVMPDPRFNKSRFIMKLHEMLGDRDHCAAVMSPLAESFTLSELRQSIARVQEAPHQKSERLNHVLECVNWLATSNYELRFPAHFAISERIIFPVSPNESKGIEDARFVRFVEDDGTAVYYATYTAYNGYTILPQLIETRDFIDFRIGTLNGRAVQNKGMALFPRKVGGQYLMLSRQDDENLFLMRSENLHHWDVEKFLMGPSEMWESVKIGNCGSPLETREGWLVITHGVGPMRRYCIGAALLDLEDPSRVIGRLSLPLIEPEDGEREGYVPNVVYSCGSLIHDGRLILPYAMNDMDTVVVSVSLELLLSKLREA